MISVLYLAVAAVVVLALVFYFGAKSRKPVPSVGSSAPDFTLNSQQGAPVNLRDFRGKWVILYFYPKDFTPGCTIEAHNFQQDIAQFETRNAVVLGVSTQDEKTHQSFCAKEGLSFRLLADRQSAVSNLYGSVINLVVAKLSARHTFLIDPAGTIQKVWLEVTPSRHSAELLAALSDLQSSRS
jgi:thioredoxin-dependent peroxiredoxin